ncbi:MAG TPA: acyltransferase [Allosphingosinicella sp.]|nr:acyltransferase [Allosphingosinicella sp.]
MSGATAPSAREELRPSGFAAPEIFFAIEGLRAVCVLIVMLFHSAGSRAEHVLPGAFFVIDFFYAVSGFVLAHAYEARLAHDLRGLGFMRLRLIRVYPLYLLALAIAVAANLGIALVRGSLPEPVLFLVSVAASALLLPLVPALAWRHHHPYPFNGTTWTLFWELAVNLIWSVLGPRLTDRLLALFVAIGAVMLVVGLSLPTRLEYGGSFASVHVGGLRVVYGFFSGVAAYRLWSRGRLPWLRLPFWASAPILLATILLRPYGGAFVYDLAATLAMPVLVFASTAQPPPRLRPLLGAAGQATYAAYILNFPLLLVLDQLLARTHLPLLMSAPVRIPLFVALVATVSIVADRRLDHPARKWLFRRFVSPERGHIPGDRPAPVSEA